MSAGWQAFKRATPRVRALFIENLSGEELAGAIDKMRNILIERGHDPCGINAIVLQEAARRLRAQ